MEQGRQDIYQIGTVIVVVLIILTCMGMLLVFINPQIAINPFKPPSELALAPPRAQPTAASGFALPATWTPTPTITLTPTETPTATPTNTLTPTPTATPTITPIPTNTPTPTPTRTATRRPTNTPLPPPPTPVPPQYPYRTVFQNCSHSGMTFIEGTVYSNEAGAQEYGIRVAMGSAPGGGDVYYVTTGSISGRSPGFYQHIITSSGAAPGNYFLWVADGSGKVLSDPNAGKVTTNSKGPDDPSACWRAVVDFVRR